MSNRKELRSCPSWQLYIFFQEYNLYILRNHCILKAGLLVPQRKDSVNHTVHTHKPKALLIRGDQ